MTRPWLALAAALFMSIGAVATSRGADPLTAVVAYGAALILATAGALARRPVPDLVAYRGGLVALGISAVICVAGRRELVTSPAAPDDAVALLTMTVAVGAAVARPASERARAVVYALALATLTLVGIVLIVATPYHSDAVVATHAGAELVLDGRHPYASFDMREQLPRFGLGTEWATNLEDGSELRSLNYPVLALVVPLPAVALGFDARSVYLLELLVLVGLVAFSAREPWRAFALAAALANVAILRQFVAAGVDPTWALLVVIAWLARERAWSAVVLGLALAARQTAWIVAPLLIAWSWARYGPRAAVRRAAITAGVFIVVHLPLAGDAQATIGGITDVIVRPLERGGVGPSMLIGDALPRGPYVALAAVLFALSGFVWWRWLSRDARARSALVVAFVPLYVASRALQSYFALLPLFLLIEEGRSDPQGDQHHRERGLRAEERPAQPAG